MQRKPEMVFGVGGLSFLGTRISSVALRDGGYLEPRTAGQPWYTGERDGGVRRHEALLKGGVDGGPVGVVDEVDLEADDVVQREAGGAELVGEVVEAAASLFGGGDARRLAVDETSGIRRRGSSPRGSPRCARR
jgi:hypothetical protein